MISSTPSSATIARCLAVRPQFVADMDGDGIEDLVVAAKCKNPMADKAEYTFVVADPYNSALGDIAT